MATCVCMCAQLLSTFFFSLSKEVGWSERVRGKGRVSAAHFLFSHSLLPCTRYTTKKWRQLFPPLPRLSVWLLLCISLYLCMPSLSCVNMNTKEIPYLPLIPLSPSISLA